MTKRPSEKQLPEVKVSQSSETLDGDALSDFLREAEAAASLMSAAARHHLKKGQPVFYVDGKNVERGTITKLDAKGKKGTV